MNRFYTAVSNYGDIASLPCSAWERWPCRSAVRDAERPLMRSHGDRGNENPANHSRAD